MVKFLMIETATDECSVALASSDGILFMKRFAEPKAHASVLAPFVWSVLREDGITARECSAVSVSMGPGSYTGLRVGVSTAKGLCYGAGIPLIGVSTLDILAYMAKERLMETGMDTDVAIVPMIDARRMEVYTAVYDAVCTRRTEIGPKVLDSDSYSELFEKYSGVVFIGDGAAKFERCLDDRKLGRSTFIPVSPSASGMFIPTLRAWESGTFEDVAYCEPFYLKDFVAGVSRRKLF